MELGLEAVLLEKDKEFGGQLLRTFNPINNYLGIRVAQALELRDRFLSQVNEHGGNVVSKAEVTQCDLVQKTVGLSDGTIFSGRSIIIATGVRRRKLGIPGEEAFKGRGVLESAVKAKDEIAGQTVLIVGGGDAAIENALILSEKAEKVIIVHRRKVFTARPEFIEKARMTDNIEFRTNAHLTAINGKNKVETAEICGPLSDSVSRLDVDAVLIRIGTEPNSELFRGQVRMDGNGYIIIAPDTSTDIQGVFAVGDVANPLAPTISAAVGQGAIAARAADRLRFSM
jgi:thioredoxin reductase (NADPH)